MKSFLKITFLFTVSLSVAACNLHKETLISGQTMGTTYNIKIIAPFFKTLSGLKKKIDRRLADVNHSMSTYLTDSEISRFNDLKNSDEKFQISEDFFQVMLVAEKLYRDTDGAWDGTINPLVNLWGFGNTGRKNMIPPKEEILKLLVEIGFNHIQLSNDRHLMKRNASLSLDLASIAKGYAVDQIARLIKRSGIENFLIEIGGDIYASGVRMDGQFWKIGINKPDPDAPYDQIYKVIAIKDKAFATSGDYRNFFTVSGKRYSHIIDPRTGYPVDNGVVSVSIIADTCVFADGLATAVMILGHKKGLELVDRLETVECLIIRRDNDGRLIDYFSRGFQAVN
jgi:thiamine biosynthesis lipoprotein